MDAPPAGLETAEADITRLAVDAIVNAANSTLLGGGGVDGAIHRAAGARIEAYCAKLGGCPTGEARLTPGFDLPARWVIHVVGPVWNGGTHGEAALLAACYRNAFALAREKRIASIAFPAVSCGVYGYPRREAAAIAVRECAAAMRADPGLTRVLLVAFDAAMLEIYREAMAAQGGAR
ncbi:MAG TPA: O-acetyl-ADP-ribose deacetylase [Rhodocyclaceae bacterium]|nr:MAG: O-acetyl-ADP-ribose deacetylase [Betaproteobacteria bacterium CG2_30_68_42]PIX76078.1 MAG: O-acetyl-ADP-ribose deacetylase [Rhodocyclales bacterium CG_4_10_14_3_um_filter_68_10]PJA57892.1 MAG: O-acetyl-ADP-ribose deacetylase [Rhodocyclales bacterium CG_4_9_14_3_um_filter_68_10]HCX32606.1 O-acetyl-ADP-ribose deacetylase [Rhodocyclaceae bacterium]